MNYNNDSKIVLLAFVRVINVEDIVLLFKLFMNFYK
jgi:hypothetical protein